jgi:phage terminase large subunit-like protein
MTYAEIAEKYCGEVVSGVVPAGNLVKLACARHIWDRERERNPGFPYRFDEKKAERRCSFSEKLVHVKGKWAGKKLKLSPHQIFIRCAVWGWVRKKDGKRRFNVVFIEIPRKNGKSVDAADSGIYMLVADGENGAEVYSGATSEKQALEVFRPAWQMVNALPALQEKFGISLSGNPKNPTCIYQLSDMSRFEPLIGKPGEGSSPHFAIVDEYHEHKTADQYDAMETGMGAREQPLMFVITTAGTDTSTPCYDMHIRAVKVLEGTIEDESFFAIIYGIDPEDDYRDFENWKKANPNYDVSVDADYLQRKYRESLTNVSKQNINFCKHLNKWMNAGVAWMNMTKWAACEDRSLRLEDFKGQTCYAALDLASKIDICASVFLFEMDRGFVAFGKYYLPEDTINIAGNEHYAKWEKEGWITGTSGAMTDFAYVEDDLKAIHQDHPIIELAYDPRESGYLINNVALWLGVDRCVPINQGPALMSEPMKELEARVAGQKLWHNGCPVMTWMMGNVVKKQGRQSGPVKYYYPTKQKAEFKIDGPVAMIMALGRAMLKTDTTSIYETQGVKVFGRVN